MSKENEDQRPSSGVDDAIARALFFTILLPAKVVGELFFLLLKKGRLLRSSIYQIALGIVVLVALVWLVSNAHGRLLNFFASIVGDSSVAWGNLILPLSLIYILIGVFNGLWLVNTALKEMKKQPHLLELEGGWQYQFKHRAGVKQLLLRKRNIEGLKGGLFIDDDSAPLGLNEEEGDIVVKRYYTEAATHTLISGASGSGKTITMQNLIRADIVNSVPTIVIDFKRSPEFASKLASWTNEAGGKFYHFVNGELKNYDIKNSRGPVYYDPLASGSPTSKADMVLGMREYDSASAVYKANMQQLLQVAFSMLHYADKKKAPSILWGQGGIYELASAVSGDNFSELAIACEGTSIQTEAEEVAEQIRSRTSGLKHAKEELQGQLRTIIASEYGRWMKTAKGDRFVNILDHTQKPGTVILFSLNSDSEPEFAKYVGSMILSDITNVSAYRRNQQIKNQVMIYVDEFQAVNPTAITGLLEKSRESQMAVTLAQQSFEQVVASAPNNGEAYLLAILDTCSNFIVHNGMTEDSAERLSKILGKKRVTEYRKSNNDSNFSNSVINTSNKEEWVFPPRKFMTLMSPNAINDYKTTAAVINKNCSDPNLAQQEGAVARRIWVIPEDVVLDRYYDPSYRLAPVREVAQIESPAVNAPEIKSSPKGADALDDAFLEAISDIVEGFDDDDDDGGFGFKEIDADELREYKNEVQAQASVSPAQAEEPAPTPTESAPRAANPKRETQEDFLSQWSTEAVSPPPSIAKIAKKTPPNHGLPRPEVNQEDDINKEESDDLDVVSLPQISQTKPQQIKKRGHGLPIPDGPM